MQHELYCSHNLIWEKFTIWNYSVSNSLHQWETDVHNYMLSCKSSFSGYKDKWNSIKAKGNWISKWSLAWENTINIH